MTAIDRPSEWANKQIATSSSNKIRIIIALINGPRRYRIHLYNDHQLYYHSVTLEDWEPVTHPHNIDHVVSQPVSMNPILLHLRNWNRFYGKLEERSFPICISFTLKPFLCYLTAVTQTNPNLNHYLYFGIIVTDLPLRTLNCRDCIRHTPTTKCCSICPLIHFRAPTTKLSKCHSGLY